MTEPGDSESPAAKRPAAKRKGPSTRRGKTLAPKIEPPVNEPPPAIAAATPASPEPGSEGGQAAIESTDISGLPSLTYPGSADAEFARWADERRRRRIRLEIGAGGVLVVLGLVATVVSRSGRFIAVTLVLAGALVAYELLIGFFE